MNYVGIHTQQSRNNYRSLLLLFLFPGLLLGLLFLFCYLINVIADDGSYDVIRLSTDMFINAAPYLLGAVLVWFIIAYFANTRIINAATGARSLERKDNKRVYNLVENLCMSVGMKMPNINIIEDSSLNAYASGINDRTYTVTLSRGIIDKLDDDELEAVIAHELSHIRNNDVKLLIISIVFVGIFTLIAQMSLRLLRTASFAGNKNNKGGGGILVMLLVAALVAGIGYFCSTLMRFAISRKREYLADAGSAEMTKNPQALANALRKISNDPDIEAVKREDVAQLFIEHPGKQAKHGLQGLSGLFATHPPIEKRIEVLEQF